MRVNSISAREAELVLCITKRYKLKIVQVYAPTTSYSDEDFNNLYNDVDETSGTPYRYTIVMGYVSARKGNRTNLCETATGQTWARIEKRKRRHLGRMGNFKKGQTYEYHVPEESREDMNVKSPNGVTKNEIDYILTTRPDIVTDVIVINQVNIGSDHIMAMNKNWT